MPFIVPIVGVESRVAQVLPRTAVQLVGARLQAGVDYRACAVADLSRIVAGLYLELRQTIRRGLGHKACAVVVVHHVDVVIHAVEDEVVLLRALSIGVEVALARAARALGRHSARRKLRNEDPVAAVKWNVVDGLRVDHLAHRALLRLHQWSFGSNRHRLSCGAWLERHHNVQPLLQIEMQIGLGSGLEACSRSGNAIAADLDR